MPTRALAQAYRHAGVTVAREAVGAPAPSVLVACPAQSRSCSLVSTALNGTPPRGPSESSCTRCTRKEYSDGGVNGRKSREWCRRKLARSRRRPSSAHIESAGHESFCGAPALSPSRSHIPDARQHPGGSVPAEPVPCAILFCRRPCFHWSSFRTRWPMCKGFSPNVASPASHR